MSDVVLKRGMERVEVDSSQVTSEILRRTFRVDPSEVWLRSEQDSRAFFPDDSGHFNLQEAHLLFGAVLGIEGPNLPLSTTPRLSVSSLAHSSSTSASASYNSNPPPPAFKSVIPKQSKETATVTVKIIRAKMESSRNGKIEFSQEAQMHLDISESTANVRHILEEVQQRWGEEYMLVTLDGLELEDCEGTQGLKFWKSPRRKVFAVPTSNQKIRKRKRQSEVVSLDSDSDDLTPKKVRDDTTIKITRIESKVNDVREDIDTMKEAIQDILHLNEKSKLPMGLQRLIRDAFQCKVCLSIPINPPVIMSKCCKTVIGCERCVNAWYSGPEALTKTCPSCRAERGYSETMILRGLDSFLIEVRKVIQTEDEKDDELLPGVVLS